MDEYRLGAVESRFAEIIWSHEPLSSGELVKLCLQELGWKKSTTYTVLRKLCDRGIFQNNDGEVTSLLSRDELYSLQSRQFVEEAFNHSLPAFLNAFIGGKGISAEEAEELKAIIDRYREEEKQ